MTENYEMSKTPPDAPPTVYLAHGRVQTEILQSVSALRLRWRPGFSCHKDAVGNVIYFKIGHLCYIWN